MAIIKKGLAAQLGNGASFTRYTVNYADLTAAALVQTLLLFNLSKGGKILGINIKHNTAFAGTGQTAMSVSVGSSVVGATGFASAFNIFQAVADTTMQETNEFKSGGYAAQDVNAYFTAVGGNLNVGTAGSVDIDVYCLDLDTPLT